MADLNVALEFTAQAGGAERAIDGLLREIARIRTEAIAAGSGDPFAGFDASLDELSRSSTAFVNQLNTIQREAGQTGAALSQAGNQASGAFANAGSPIESMTGSIGRLAAAAGGIYAVGAAIKSVVTTGSDFEQLGIRMTSVMGSIAEGEKATGWIQKFAKDTPLQLDGVTSVFLKLKNFGLDPMDGTLQKLTDAASKYGTGQEGLERISLALGQAWGKQKLQGQEILQLIEAGVPVWELLAKSTGKSVPELQKLSEAGKLGKETIKGLIDAMGNDALGASAAQMNTVNGAWSNFLDTLDKVKVAIFNSGMGDELKTQLQSITAEIQKMADDGRLKKFATELGSAFGTIASAIGGATKFIIEHIDAIKTLAVSFAAFKTDQFVGGITSANSALRNFVTTAASTNLTMTGSRAAIAGSIDEMRRFGATSVATGATVRGLAGGLTVVGAGISRVGAALSGLRAIIATNPIGAIIVALTALTPLVDRAMKSLSGLTDAEKKDAEAQRNLELQIKLRTERLKQAYEASDEGIKKHRAEIEATAAASMKALQALETEAKLSGDKLALGMVQSFQKLKDAGKTTAEAIADAFKFDNVNAGNPAFIASWLNGLGELRRVNEITAKELAETLQGTIKNIDTSGLEKLGIALKMAFDTGKISAQQFAETSKVLVGQALERLGVDAQLANTGISKSFNETITLLKVVASNAQTTGKELVAAFQKSIDGAKTGNEIKLVQEQIKKLSGDTRLSKEEFARLEKAGVDAANNIAKATDKTAEAFSRMGIKSKQELAAIAAQSKADFDAIAKSGSATASGLSEAFKKYATNAIAANNGVATAEITATAAVYGLKVAIDSTGKAFIESADKAKAASSEIVAAKEKEAHATNNTANAEAQKAEAEKKAAAESEKAAKATADAASKSMLDVKGLELSINNLSVSLSNMSKSAYKAFVTSNNMGQWIDDIDIMKSSTEDLSKYLANLANNVEKGTGTFAQLQNAMYQANVNVVNQALDVRRLTEAYEKMDGTINIAGDSAEDLAKRFNLLDENQLSQLKSAIDAAKQRMQAFADLVKGVREQLDDTINALKDEKLQRDGNEAQRLKNKAAADKAKIDEEVAKTKGDKEAKQKGEEAKKLIDEKLAIELAALDKKAKADKDASNERKKQIEEEAKAKELANNKELEQIKKIEEVKAKANDAIVKKITDDLPPKPPTYSPKPNDSDNKPSASGAMSFVVNLNGITEITPEVVRAKVVPVIQDIIRKSK